MYKCKVQVFRANVPNGAQRGFTLVELLMVVAVGGLLIGVGIPQMRDMILTQRVRAATTSLYAAMVYARSEAIKRNSSVGVVPTSGVWSSGWTIRVLSSDTVLRRHARLSALTVNGPSSTVSFGPNGRLSSGSSNFDLSATESSMAVDRCVVVDTSGRPRIKAGSCSG